MRRTGLRLLSSTALAAGLAVAAFTLPFAASVSTPAAAQERVEVSAEFRGALEPHGKWQRHQRWGEVWVPGDVGRDWRPYTRGRWVYSDDYGWYWNAAEQEASWGTVVYHYGRWVEDDQIGWAWVPGNEWAPAWVDWRRGDKAVGWAPLPPDEIVVEVRERPAYWTFVRPRDLVAASIASVLLPVRERDVYLRDTVIVNRTVVVSDRGPRFAVNPGIPPAYIAAAYGRPIRTWSVQPRILAGTGMVPGGVEVRVDDLRDRRSRVMRDRSYIRESRTTVAPARNVPAPQALDGDRGRLGDNPPRAAREGGRDAPAGAAERRQPGQQPGQATGARDGERGPATGERRDGAPTQREGARPGDRDNTREGTGPRDRDNAREGTNARDRDNARDNARDDQRESTRPDADRSRAARDKDKADDRRQKGAERRQDRREQRQEQSERGGRDAAPSRNERQGAERSGPDRSGPGRSGAAEQRSGERPAAAERGGSERGASERGASGRGGGERPAATTGRGGGDAPSAGRGGAAERSPGAAGGRGGAGPGSRDGEGGGAERGGGAGGGGGPGGGGGAGGASPGGPGGAR